MWSAVDIINTHRVFTKEPIRKQEIKLECTPTAPRLRKVLLVCDRVRERTIILFSPGKVVNILHV